MAGSKEKNTIHLKVITPVKTFYDDDIEMIIVKCLDGEEGFMAGHIRACKLLDIGEMWIQEPGAEDLRPASIAGGFIDVRDDIVLFTDDAEWREDIDPERAKNALEEARAWLEENRDTAADLYVTKAESAIKRNESRLRVYEGARRDRKRK